MVNLTTNTPDHRYILRNKFTFIIMESISTVIETTESKKFKAENNTNDGAIDEDKNEAVENDERVTEIAEVVVDCHIVHICETESHNIESKINIECTDNQVSPMCKIDYISNVSSAVLPIDDVKIQVQKLSDAIPTTTQVEQEEEELQIVIVSKNDDTKKKKRTNVPFLDDNINPDRGDVTDHLSLLEARHGRRNWWDWKKILAAIILVIIIIILSTAFDGHHGL